MQILARGGELERNPFLFDSLGVTDEQKDLLWALAGINKSIISEDDWITVKNIAEGIEKNRLDRAAMEEVWNKIENTNNTFYPKVYTFSGTGEKAIIPTGNKYLDNYKLPGNYASYLDLHIDPFIRYNVLSEANKVYDKYKTINNMENPILLDEVVIKERQDKYRRPKLKRIDGVPVLPWVKSFNQREREILSSLKKILPNYGYNIESGRENPIEKAPVTIKANNNSLSYILSPYTNPRGVKTSPNRPLRLQGVTISEQKREPVGDIRGPYKAKKIYDEGPGNNSHYIIIDRDDTEN
jgi:hypothetical protein